jgi:hypothetical protein
MSEFMQAPGRQIMCVLQGEVEATASDGETRRFPPGAVLLLEDTIGKGHATRVVGASRSSSSASLWPTERRVAVSLGVQNRKLR